MKKFTARTAAIILALILTASALASCANNNSNQTEQSTPAVGSDGTSAVTEAVTENPYDEKGYMKDSLPADLKYGNETFTLLYWSDREHEEFVSEGQNGDAVNDAIYTRNVNVEERLGIKFNYEKTAGNAQSANIQNFTTVLETGIKSGERPYDMVAAHSFTIGNCAVKGLLSDLREAEYIDFSKPWWPQSLINDATINGRLYFASGDISANTIYMMYVTFFNKDILDDRKLENPYDLVEKNEWTIDKMFEMCEGLYSDDNDSKTPDLGDFYGQYAYTLHLDMFATGSGIKILEVKNGTLEFSEDFLGDKMQSICDKVTQFFASNDRAYLMTVNDKVHQWFSAGKSLFWNDRCRNAITFKDNEVSYGIVPNPKYDTDQKEFYTVLGNPFSLYAIPNDTEDLDRAGAVMECYASQSYRTVSPALYEITMKYRYTDDAVSSAMFDTIKSSVIFDLGRIFASALKTPYSSFETAVSGKTSWSRVVSQNIRSTWSNGLKSILQAFEN